MLKEIEICLKRENRKEILYITDDLMLLRNMKKEGKPVAAVLTEHNRWEDFSGISYALEQIEELEQEDFEKIYRRLSGLPWDILETERCCLREMTEEDLDALYEIYSDESITRYMEGLYENPEEEREYITEYRKYVYEFYEYGMWVIEEKENGRIIGRAGVDPRGEENELGYVIGKSWQGLGYAYEVCSAIVNYMWQQGGCEEIISRVHRENEASVKLLEKLGFVKRKPNEGDKKEEAMECYCIKKGGFR